MRRRRGGRPAAAVLQGRPLVALGAAATWSTTTCASTTGIEATAKDFRTWHATVLAAAALAETAGAGRDARRRASGRSSAAMKEVASFLGNTPTLARSAYVDPRVVDAYEEGRTIEPRHPAQLRHRRRAPGGAGARHARAAEGELSIGAWRSRVVEGDITTQEVDAVVNAANRGCGAAAASTARSTAAGGPGGARGLRARGSRDGLATGDAGWTTAGRAAGALGDPRGRPEPRRRPDRPLAADLLLRPRAGGRRRARRAHAWRSRWSAPASTAGRRTTRSPPPSQTLRDTPTPASRRRGWSRSAAPTYDAIRARLAE